MIRTPTLVAPVVALTVVAAVAAGCSDDSDDPGPDGPTSTSAASPSTPTAAPVTTDVTIRTVTGGRLPRADRDQLRDKIGETVDEWFDAAYLGGDYPRTDFDDAFGVFTPRARAEAVRDTRLMSNAAVGTTTFGVRALARRVRIDVLADSGRAAGVTVQFRLGMARAGDTGAEREERVSGHLYLTYVAGDGWSVFGYDVRRGDL